ncbi:6,7-dimethyl-8-ribityllumazine synthase [Betaproteobacteria bacterium SCN1]|jgi:6,7-dimethyl-8-ribityllumazine synthase|nr:6,7-dimethyl-8-ribityllumazine synthase [Betaproteobacteria bacterium SCN1]MBN8760274.1 6,7-dimethyl-8-ribityllumazine synthase [Thiobacillus sp.]ODU90010.1 MAG: 6,7-dimethyl-8-ribityllumazine synthase [Thiobacillus sp. SCN 65-179]OJW39668.1 MAG: 6,7-dimethyl-8-ribityllumazine synthase [Thiobacillus sp. 65-69]
MGNNTSINELDPVYNGKGLRIGIVMSRFNKDICEGLLSACDTELIRLGVAREDVLLVDVPGALEHPLALQKMAQSGQYDALVALGAVVRGETYHFEIVANESSRGILDVQLETGVPIANAILTVETEEQAHARMAEKGRDAARVAIEMANLMKRL